MTFETMLQSLRAHSRRRPFRPFVIQLLGGETLAVAHPEAWQLFNELLMLTLPDGLRRMFDSWSVLQFIETPPKAPSGPTNNGEEEA
jgi:hypothetical protein